MYQSNHTRDGLYLFDLDSVLTAALISVFRIDALLVVSYPKCQTHRASLRNASFFDRDRAGIYIRLTSIMLIRTEWQQRQNNMSRILILFKISYGFAICFLSEPEPEFRSRFGYRIEWMSSLCVRTAPIVGLSYQNTNSNSGHRRSLAAMVIRTPNR